MSDEAAHQPPAPSDSTGHSAAGAPPSPRSQIAPPSGFDPPWWTQVLTLVALCAVLFVMGLGDRGLAYSEGHRVGPAWEMLDAGMPGDAADAWLVPHLFGVPYLRKPPGMAWAIAASTALFGRNEFAARLPSALAMLVLVLVSWRVTTRWLGSPWGLVAGLALALFPFFWSSARSAEIEMLHAAGAGGAALLLADVMLRREGPRWLAALGAGIGIAVMALTKGPAGVPLILAVPIGVCLARRSISPLARPSLALALLIPGLALGLTAYGAFNALGRTTQPVITQGVGEFLWEPAKILRILTLPAAAWGSMLPASLALLVVLWNPSRPGAAAMDTPRDHPDMIGRALGLSWLLAVGAYTLMGVSNPRYLLPTAALLPPVVAMAIAGLRVRAESGGFSASRRGLARVAALGWPGSWPVVLAIGFVGFLAFYEAPRGRTSGDAAGTALAAVLGPDAARGATVWTDELVECRPEVLLYARTWTPLLHIRWSKPLESATPSPGDILIVRTDRHALADGAPTERDRCAAMLAGAAPIHQFTVHKYAFEVYRLGITRDPGSGGPPAAIRPE